MLNYAEPRDLSAKLGTTIINCNTTFYVLAGSKQSTTNVSVIGSTAYVMHETDSKVYQGLKFDFDALDGVKLDTLQDGMNKVLVTDKQTFLCSWNHHM